MAFLTYGVVDSRVTAADPHGRSSLHSTARYLGRVVLALLGFTSLLFPVLAIVVPPDPFAQMFGLVVLFPLLLVAATGYVRLCGSVRQLGGFLLAVFLLLLPLWIPYAAYVVLLRLLDVPYGLLDTVGQAVILVADYAGAYYLVYRGGYERLRTRLARLT